MHTAISLSPPLPVGATFVLNVPTSLHCRTFFGCALESVSPRQDMAAPSCLPLMVLAALAAVAASDLAYQLDLFDPGRAAVAAAELNVSRPCAVAMAAFADGLAAHDEWAAKSEYGFFASRKFFQLRPRKAGRLAGQVQLAI